MIRAAMVRKLLAWIGVIVLTGCIGAPPQPSIPHPPSTPTTVGRDVGAPSSPAATLLSQARSDRAAGALASAESTIERALRIEPNDPWLWIELGEIKRAAGDSSQAAAMGRKALSLAAGDREVETSARALVRD